MNSPNFASRNHAIFSSWDAGVGNGAGNCVIGGGFEIADVEHVLSPQHDSRVEQPYMKTTANKEMALSARSR